MTKKLISMLLAALMVLMLLPVLTFADKASNWELLKKALASETDQSVEGVYTITHTNLSFKEITLLTDTDAGNEDIAIPEYVFLNLNGYDLKTTGKINNNGIITFSQQNAKLADTVLWNVAGSYGVSGEIKIPNESSPEIILPDGTFLTVESGKNPYFVQYDFASGEGYLVWNRDVEAGTIIDVTYALALGGDVLSTKGSSSKNTSVTANKLKLGDNITVGSNETGYGEAVLSVESIYDDLFGDTIGTFNANGKTITLNKTGKFVISSDIAFNPSVLVSGVKGMVVKKEMDRINKKVTYTIGYPSDTVVIEIGKQTEETKEENPSTGAPDFVPLAAMLTALCLGVTKKKNKNR